MEAIAIVWLEGGKKYLFFISQCSMVLQNPISFTLKIASVEKQYIEQNNIEVGTLFKCSDYSNLQKEVKKRVG